jgi:hypothetical protein
MGYLAILDYLCSADDIVYLRKKLCRKSFFIIGPLRKESFNRQLVLEAENRDIRKDAPEGFS